MAQKDDLTRNYRDAICKILDDSKTQKIINEAKKDDPNGYLKIYESIIPAVRTMRKNEDTIRILPMVVYGWMPTVLRNSKWDSKWDGQIRTLLNSKTGEFSDEDMQILLHFVNDSYIGVSKLLHFTYPDHWAIWDSNVYAAIEYYAAEEPKKNLSWYCLNNHGRVDNKTRFNAYQNAIREVRNDRGGELREIEKCIFYVGRKLKSSIEKPKRTAAQNTVDS